MNLLYILSPSFSGSTLLTFILDRHDQIHTFGELKATSMGPLNRYYCSCGSLIENCPYWADLRKRCEDRGAPFCLERFGTHFTSDNYIRAKVMGAQVRGSTFETTRRLCISILPGLRKDYARILRQNREIICAVMEGHEDDWFLDGSKDPSRLMYLARSGYWHVKVLKMCRDGRAQSNSSRRKSDVSFEVAAREWKSEIEQIDRVAQMFSQSDVFELRYEDLCADPAATANRIWAFLGLEPAKIDWDQPLNKDGSHILGNNNMRQSTNIRIRLDDTWKDELSTEDLQSFEQIAGNTNRNLGYP